MYSVFHWFNSNGKVNFFKIQYNGKYRTQMENYTIQIENYGAQMEIIENKWKRSNTATLNDMP
jgi:chloramphenicol O-acetyltransferase